ncbi:MAG TPA: hypothetical protein VF796_16920 [Humisphaera sp.]
MPVDPRDFKLELSDRARSALSDPSQAAPAAPTPSRTPRPFLSVHFECCGVYQRVYRSPDGREYAGRCPRCAAPVRFPVGPGGTSTRSFTVR